MPVFGFPACEWLWCLTALQACCWCLFLALQSVGGHCALMHFKAADDIYSWLSRMWVAAVPWYLSRLLIDACSWLFRKWVAAVPWCISRLLLMHILGSPACEWLLCLAAFKVADNVCSWFCSLWVVAVPFGVSRLLIMLVLGSAACEWLLSLCFKAADNACPWLCSLWVAAVFLFQGCR